MKKISKKIFAVLLAFTLILGIIPITAFAATTVDSGSFSGGLKWTVNSDGVLTISGKGAIGDFDEDMPPWFGYYEDITAVVISDGITRIGNYAFSLLYNVSEVTISSSVTEIGYYSFAYCESITEITLPSRLKSVGDYAFQGCISLKTVNIPASLENLGFCAFTDCYSLADFTVNSDNPYFSVGDKDVLLNKDKSELIVAPANLKGSYIIPNTVKIIDSFAFSNSISVESINIHADIELIGLAAFLGCESLEAVNVNEANKVFSSDTNGVLFDKEKSVVIYAPTNMHGEYIIPNSVKIIYPYAFALADRIIEVVIPDSVTDIGPYAFTSSTLEYMTIPDSVEYIGDAAFADCADLVDIRFEGDAPEVGTETPVFEESSATVYYPRNNSTWTSSVRKSFGGEITWIANGAGIVAQGSYDTNVRWKLEDNGTFTVSGKGKVIDYADFIYPWYNYKDQIKTLIVEEGITLIGQWTFAECKNLTSITLPSSVKDLLLNVFENCTSLVEVNFSEGLDSLQQPFVGCTSLSEIKLPASVTYISPGSFDNCTSLTGIWVDENSKYHSNDEYGVLFNKDGTVLMEIPDSLKGEYVVPDGVKSIESKAFANCSGITNIILPESLTAIRSNAFTNCTGLKSVVIPKNVVSLEWGEFAYCSNLTEIWFEGDFPVGMDKATFLDVTATAYYPENNDTWTSDVRNSYGGELTWTAYTPATRPMGDVDGDGEITNADLVKVARYIVNLYDSEVEKAIIEQYGDIDGDGSVTNADVVKIARIIVDLPID